MKALRIFAAADGRAQVEWRAVPLAPDASGRPTSMRFPAREFYFRDTPPEHDRGKHRAPQRQLIVVLGGIGAIELDDGSMHRFHPGDLLFAENTTGTGHVTHCIEGVRSFLHLPVPDDFDVTAWPLAWVLNRGGRVMKAAYFMQHGGPEVMQYGDVPDPVAGPGQVLVDVHAASVNGADWKVRAGSYAPITSFPYIPGRDFSGVVCALGPGVQDLKIGDAVFGVCDVGQEAAYAERVAIKAAIVAPKPASLSHETCAALALAGLTALVSIEDTLALKAGEKILIQGGAGGVAGIAIQIAKHIGARVISTASASNLDYVRGLGADEVIDYRSQDFTRVVSGCDAVFDTVGGDVAQRSFQVLRPGGRAAFIASGGKAPPAPRPEVTSLRPQVGRDRAHLERVAQLAVAGAIRAPEMRLFPLSEAAAAHSISEGRHLRGKLVFKLH